MTASLLVRASAAVLLLAGAVAGPANAQSYDGGGILKFGIYGQGMMQTYGITQPGSAEASANGFGLGMSFGYDLLQRNGWLYGLELDGSFGDSRGNALGTNYGFDYLLMLRGRLGTYMRPDLMVYGTGGLAMLGIEAQRPNVGDKAYETLGGLTIGVGGEWDWGHHLLFAEYNFAGFASRAFTVDDIRHDTDAHMHMLRFGFKFKTGHDHYHGVSRDPYYPGVK